MSRESTKEERIASFNKTHNNKYDYSLFEEYVNAHQEIKIICPEHGIFSKKIYKHEKEGCPHCSLIDKHKKLSKTHMKKEHGEDLTPTESFIKKAKSIHGDTYDYSKTVYESARKPVTIFCNMCGNYFTLSRAGGHVSKPARGCNICAPKRRGESNRKKSEKYIKECEELHEGYYKYDKTKYISNEESVKVYCTNCEVYFDVNAGDHLHRKNGCKICSGERCVKDRRLTKEEIVRRGNEVHQNKYEYKFLGEVKSNKDKFVIICSDHGEQKPQIINDHINKNVGCPSCKRSKGEEKIAFWLDVNNIEYNPQHPFDDCIHKNKLPFDFYLPEFNVLLEYNGEHHYKYLEYFHKTKEEFDEQQKRDQIKREYCKQNNIKLIEIPYWDFKNIEKILDKELLI
jgi:hypothetical protein